MKDGRKETESEPLNPEFIFNIVKNTAKIKDWGVTDPQFQLLYYFSFTR